MKPTVYIETTVVSYLTARASNDPLVAGEMAETQKWWRDVGPDYDLTTSQLVIDEASRGDPIAAQERLAILASLDLLPITESAKALALSLVNENALPAKAQVDALHVAIAATNGIEYLITWNCRHLANATLRSRIEQVCRESGFEPPVICTPLELSKV